MAWETSTNEYRQKRPYRFKGGVHLVTQTFYDGFWAWLVLDKDGKLLSSYMNYEDAAEYAKNYKN